MKKVGKLLASIILAYFSWLLAGLFVTATFWMPLILFPQLHIQLNTVALFVESLLYPPTFVFVGTAIISSRWVVWFFSALYLLTIQGPLFISWVVLGKSETGVSQAWLTIGWFVAIISLLMTTYILLIDRPKVLQMEEGT